MKRGIFAVIAGILILSSAAMAEEGVDNTERLIFIPKACGLNYGEYNINFRMYNEGGMLTRAVFGVIQGLNVGFSWDILHLIGTETAMGRNPQLYLKFDLYRGGRLMPATSVGYDAQGYEWNAGTKKYDSSPVGFFLVMSKELMLNNFYLTGGGDYDTEDKNPDHSFTDKLNGFAGFNFKPSKFSVYGEAINIGRGSEYCRINGGALYEIVEGLQFMLAFENISEAGKVNKQQQRTFSILYRGAF